MNNHVPSFPSLHIEESSLAWGRMGGQTEALPVMEQFSVYVRIRKFIRFYEVIRILYFLNVILRVKYCHGYLESIPYFLCTLID